MANAERYQFVMCDYEFIEFGSMGAEISSSNELVVGGRAEFFNNLLMP